MRFVQMRIQAGAFRAILLGLFLGFGAAPNSLHAASETVHQLDEMLPGLKPRQAYDVSGIEQLNVLSGDPHLAIPLGPAYPLRGCEAFSGSIRES